MNYNEQVSSFNLLFYIVYKCSLNRDYEYCGNEKNRKYNNESMMSNYKKCL